MLYNISMNRLLLPLVVLLVVLAINFHVVEYGLGAAMLLVSLVTWIGVRRILRMLMAVFTFMGAVGG